MKKILNKINWLCIFLLAVAIAGPVAAQRDAAPGSQAAPRERVQFRLGEISVAALPPEARATLKLIDKGGPYPYDRDGIVFGNFEKRLPLKDRGYYQEFTVKTPGVNHRGARRIVAGKGGDKYYSDDHYTTFKRIAP